MSSELGYPEDWDNSAREFWDDNMSGMEPWYSQEQWDQAQDAFELGFLNDMHPDLSIDGYEVFRDEFYEITGMDSADFDWEGWRDYMGYGEAA